VSGKYRGKKLKEFKLESTKPTLDRVKESIFNLIQFDVIDAVVLDLFSGTGGLGIEAISRGARRTVLVDINPEAIKIIKENLKGIEGDFVIKHMDYLDYLRGDNDKYDIVLLDPPYNTDFGVKAIDFIIKNDRLNQGGIIIFETSEVKEFEFDYDGYKIIKKKYGKVAVYKIEKE